MNNKRKMKKKKKKKGVHILKQKSTRFRVLGIWPGLYDYIANLSELQTLYKMRYLNLIISATPL
jgi:hypothetical protein